jgi:hypothetical protein
MTDPLRHDRFALTTATERRPGRVTPGQHALFFTPDHHTLPLCQAYRGATAVLICGGPGADIPRLTALPGVVVAAINNAAETFRPDIWFGLDEPSRFLKRIWMDPGIQKFFPLAYADKPIGKDDITAAETPNTVFIRRNDAFNPRTWFEESTINWGDDVGPDERRGGRSTMIAALRVLYSLGFAKIIIAGADMKMVPGKGAYSHSQEASEIHARRNNNLYAYLNLEVFPKLATGFAERGVDVVVVPPTTITAFRSVDLAAIEADLTARWAPLAEQTSAGLYDPHYAAKAPPYWEFLGPIDTELGQQGVSAEVKSRSFIKGAWDTYITRRLDFDTAAKASFEQGQALWPEVQQAHDAAMAAVGLPQLHSPAESASYAPQVFPQLRGRWCISGNAAEGDSAIHPDAFDVVVRVGATRLEPLGRRLGDRGTPYPTIGTRTDVWVICPEAGDVTAESVGPLLAKLKPGLVVLVFPQVRRPEAQAVAAELRAELVERAQAHVVMESWDLSPYGEALRFALARGADDITRVRCGLSGQTFWGSPNYSVSPGETIWLAKVASTRPWLGLPVAETDLHRVAVVLHNGETLEWFSATTYLKAWKSIPDIGTATTPSARLAGSAAWARARHWVQRRDLLALYWLHGGGLTTDPVGVAALPPPAVTAFTIATDHWGDPCLDAMAAPPGCAGVADTIAALEGDDIDWADPGAVLDTVLRVSPQRFPTEAFFPLSPDDAQALLDKPAAAQAFAVEDLLNRTPVYAVLREPRWSRLKRKAQ